MDLAAFLTRAHQNGTLTAIANGFENSQFSQDIPDCGIIVKDILDKLNKAMPKRIEIHTVTGAISNTSLQPDTKKVAANSFSMEFNTICNNLLAICGYELSYNVSILLSLQHIIKQYIDDISNADDYEAVISNLTVLRNIFKRDTLDVKSFDSRFINSAEDDTNVFRFDSEIKPVKEEFFGAIIEHAIKNMERKNISGLSMNKQLYTEQLIALLDNTQFMPIEPIHINELLSNIGNKVAYTGWFIKAWSMIYDEIIVDMLTSDISMSSHPLDVLFERLKITIHKNKYISQFLVYFEQVIGETKTCINELLGKDMLVVEPSKDLLKYMAEMMLSLYTQLAYALYNHQRYNTFNKSARVHYALMYYLILNCKPKLYEYDITQQSALRYLLLPKKAIDESINLLKDKRNNSKRRIIEDSIMRVGLDTDDNLDEETDKQESIKKPRNTRTVKKPLTQPVQKEAAKKTTRKPRTRKADA